MITKINELKDSFHTIKYKIQNYELELHITDIWPKTLPYPIELSNNLDTLINDNIDFLEYECILEINIPYTLAVTKQDAENLIYDLYDTAEIIKSNSNNNIKENKIQKPKNIILSGEYVEPFNFENDNEQLLFTEYNKLWDYITYLEKEIKTLIKQNI